MGKIERLLSIVMILLQSDVVSATDFSRLFHVSKRTILRDMEALSQSNIPIYALHGVNGGFGIMEQYKLDKRLLSTNDLENVLVALSGLEQIFANNDIELTVKKIESMVRRSSSKRSIHLSFYKWEGRKEIQQLAAICQQAIVESRLVSFDYLDRSGVATSRRIEPYELHFNERSWYLKGFCLERNASRTFKLSRTDRLHIERATFQPRLAAEETVAEPDAPMQLIAIKVLIAPRVKEQFVERYGRQCISVSDSHPDRLVAAITVPLGALGYQFLAGFGQELQVIEPEPYVRQFRDYLAGMLGVYK